jgi:hypothetical protein
MKRAIIAAAVIALLATACGADAEEVTLTGRGGETLPVSLWEGRTRALIEDNGYTLVCGTALSSERESFESGDYGESTVEDMEQMLALWARVCDEHAASR